MMPYDQGRIQVELLGEIFTVKGDSHEEDIRKISAFLQEQFDLMNVQYPSLSAKNLAILTAFRLADEYLRIRKDYEAIVNILDKQ
ncbi:MAG: cell division protein ZapA [Clostridiales bacterium]|nr:cell division protein ZapA [Clostridiales bacterium]